MKRFCIPPEKTAAFVQAMEDVLDVYHLPYDSKRPVICFDETSKQLVSHVRQPIAASPGTVARVDDEYSRCGTANIFLAVEPLTGQLTIQATEQRRIVDCARFLAHLADNVYPDADTILLVCDNLNTHNLSSFYEAFPPEEARRLALRFELHHTPKHGSWLNVAECELSILSRQCLDQRISSMEQLQQELEAWEDDRKVSSIRWQFKTADARVKLRRLYPIMSIETKH